MKKNIIMIVIILICSISLLFVMYNIKLKDIYYVSENNNSNIELTMKLGTTEITSFSDLDSSKYYRIDTDNTSCDNTNTKLYWSNSTQKLKVSGVTTGLKCSIAFEEIREDVNIVAIYVNGVEITSDLTSGVDYYLDSYECSNGETASWDNDSRKISITPLTSKTYCTLNFLSPTGYNSNYEFISALSDIASPGSLCGFLSSRDTIWTMVNNRNVLLYLKDNHDVYETMRNCSNFVTNVAFHYFSISPAMTQDEKMDSGLPIFIYHVDYRAAKRIQTYGCASDSNLAVYGSVAYTATSSQPSTLSIGYGPGVCYFSSEEIDTSNYNKIYAQYAISTDYPTTLTCTAQIGLYQEPEGGIFSRSIPFVTGYLSESYPLTSSGSSYQAKYISVSTSGKSKIGIGLNHGSEVGGYSCFMAIEVLGLY